MQSMPESDVLVIGGGLAAMYAAAAAAGEGGTATLLSKAPAGHSGSSLIAMSVHRFAPPEEELAADYRAKFLESAKGIADPGLVDLLVGRGAASVERLADFGIELHYKHVARQGSQYPYLACCRPKLGRHLTYPAISHLRTLPGVRVLEGYMAFQLVVDGGRVRGALAERDNEVLFFPAGAVVLAAGGAGNVYRHTNNTNDLTGDGYAMAFAAGQPLRDMEFVQFYPYGVYSPARFNIFPDLFARGARSLNEKGERFMDAFPGKELENRDILTREIYRQKEVYFDLAECDQDFLRGECPDIYAAYRKYRGERLLVRPVTHFFMGGVPIRPDCSTDVPGLYCCGEAAGGLHGANRIAGSALTETAVFGPLAGRGAAAFARTNGRNSVRSGRPDLPESGNDDPAGLRRDLRETMWSNAALIRNAESLLRARRDLDAVESGLARLRPARLRAWLECRSLLAVARCVVGSAAFRRESRGAHYRDDYREMNPAWTGSVFIGRDGPVFKPAEMP